MYNKHRHSTPTDIVYMKTANTLAFALGLLALHPDIQEIFYQSIRDAIPDGQIPVSGTLFAICSPSDPIQTYEHIPKLDYGMAIIYETLRMYPIVGGEDFLNLSGSNVHTGPRYPKAFGTRHRIYNHQ